MGGKDMNLKKKKDISDKECPLVYKLEKLGTRKKVGEIKGKYIVGYKIASKVKKQHKKFFMIYGGKPSEGRLYFERFFVIDRENPYTFIW
jgi:hypothetical protein